jgi:hypothetical protein
MKIAVFAAVFVVVAGIFGRLFKPTEEQKRPLVPDASAASDEHDHHH